MSDDAGLAFAEIFGNRDPDIPAAEPRLVVRCKECRQVLGQVYATRYGHLCVSRNARQGWIDAETKEISRRTPISTSGLLEDSTSLGVLEFKCAKHGWLRARTAAGMLSLVRGSGTRTATVEL